VSDRSESQQDKLDLAARAAWLYYIGGKTQDEIASALNISRPAAQRLVAFAVSEKLIKFRLDHPIASCMELAQAVVDRYGLAFCDVVPSDPTKLESRSLVAASAAGWLEKHIAQKAPAVIAVGTGRTLRATVQQFSPVERPQHKIVSRVGNMARDGSASAFDVVMRLADRVGGQRFPMPTPVVADSAEERELLQAQRPFQVVRELTAQAQATFVGLAGIGWKTPMHEDGFINDAELGELTERGAVGEITGWAFDDNGRLIEDSVNARLVSIPLEQPAKQLIIAVAAGPSKVVPIRAALRGQLISGLITDEAVARGVLNPS